MTELTQLAISGPLLVAVGLALAAGVISFASPCCLPLVPGYIGYLAGLAGTSASAPDRPRSVTAGPGTPLRGDAIGPETTTDLRPPQRWRLAGAAALFVAGFTVVFTSGALLVLGLSDWLITNELLLQRVGGVLTISMGLVFLGWIPVLQRDLRIHRLPRSGWAGAPVLGAVYGLGWTPCLGPTLTGVVALAAGTEVGPSTVRGLLLVLAYCAGLGVPFVLIALGTGWAVRTAGWLRRHIRALQLSGGVMLLVLGTLLVTGAWGAFIAWLRSPIAGYTLPL
ncbi:cytochrome c biogenesis CcdA family protein [Pseudonocardia sp. D17]|uniref:cytochrome c biogenesis CcdA family protein n=1 Tax=Pseudonocardia sp. D17 TaxID=882661 RepID=UPI002B379F27|nr:cytochrome C biogenesis protein CcdA [Pseudonocardia sp. D17]